MILDDNDAFFSGFRIADNNLAALLLSNNKTMIDRVGSACNFFERRALSIFFEEVEFVF